MDCRQFSACCHQRSFQSTRSYNGPNERFFRQNPSARIFGGIVSFPVVLMGDFSLRSTPQTRLGNMNHKERYPAVARSRQPLDDRFFDTSALRLANCRVLNTDSIEKIDGDAPGLNERSAIMAGAGRFRKSRNFDDLVLIPECGSQRLRRTEFPPLIWAGPSGTVPRRGPDLTGCSGFSGWFSSQQLVQPGHKLASGKHLPKSGGRSGLKPCGVHMRTKGNGVLQDTR